MDLKTILEVIESIDLAVVALEDTGADLDRYPADEILKDLVRARKYARLLGFRAIGKEEEWWHEQGLEK